MRLAYVTVAGRLLPQQVVSFSSSRCATRPAARTSVLRMCATNSPSSGETAVASVEKKISAAFSPTRLVVNPKHGDPNGSHVSITVVSDAFEGLTLVKRHQAVYKTIWEELSGPIHAVDTLVTKTPSEDS